MTETKIHFACERCGKRYRCPTTYAGRKTECGQCGEPLTVPDTASKTPPKPATPKGSAAGIVSFSCGLCSTRMSVPPEYVGHKVKCPDCNHSTEVPKPEAVRAKPRPAAMSGEQYEVYEGEEQPRGIDLARASLKSVSFECRVCQTHLQAPETEIGQPVTCPDCGVDTPVPERAKKEQPKTLVVDDYEVEEEEATAPSSSLFDDYVSKPPLGYKTHADRGDDPKRRRDDRIERTVEAPRWGLGIFSDLVTCFTSSNMLMALLGLSLAMLLTLPMVPLTGAVLVSIGFAGFVVWLILSAISLAITLIWVGVASSIYWATLSDSAAGSRRVEDWPTIDPGEWIGPTLCLVFSNVVAVIPGALVAGAVNEVNPDLAPLIGFVGVWLTLPWVQLAQLDNGSPWGVVSGRIARTLRHAPITWLVFYAVTLALGLLSIEIVEVAIERLGAWSALIISPVFVIETVLYAWLLGRLGWAAGAATPEKHTSATD